MSALFEDGIYFGLPEHLYRADPALGSTDHKKLAMAPEAYWFGSVHNRGRRTPDEDTRARLRGRAVHKCALEGRDAFEEAFIRRPDGVKVMTEKMQAVYAPRGEGILNGDDYDRVLIASTQIRNHPDLRSALSNGFPEVSIFWTTEEGGQEVRCKARIDWLKPRALVDLKSAAIKRLAPFPLLCLRDIRKFGYLVQTDLYLEARSHVGRFVEEGRVVALGEAPEPAWLDALAEAEAYAFVFIFWASEGPELVWPTQLSPGNPELDDARASIVAARRNYVEYRQQFGLDTPWIKYEPLCEATSSDFDAAFSRNI